MPTAQPTQVIVHRIELQKSERQYLEKYLDEQTKFKLANSITSGVKPVLLAGVGFGAVWLSLKVYTEIQAALNGPIEDVKNGIVGIFAKQDEKLTKLILARAGVDPKIAFLNGEYDADGNGLLSPEEKARFVADQREYVRKVKESRAEFYELIGNPFTVYNPASWGAWFERGSE